MRKLRRPAIAPIEGIIKRKDSKLVSIKKNEMRKEERK
jgi:hypothetical protein